MNWIRMRVLYSGRVQGVFFRATAADFAQQLGVCGFVQNRSDGTVLLEAQAAPDAVESLLNRIAARYADAIESAERSPLPPVADETQFVIRR